jgi:type II secretory pathway pseudopilin PulG
VNLRLFVSTSNQRSRALISQRRHLTAAQEANTLMPTRLWLRLAEILIAAAIAATVFAAWRADRRDRAQLAADLAAAKQTLAQADTRQHDRDAQLLQTLATLAAGKRAVTTPAQIIRDLPNQIPLPVPITLQSPNPTNPEKPPCSSGLPRSLKGPKCGPEDLEPTRPITNPTSNVAATQAVIPAADLKPLYDFALDCKACQAKLAAAQADLTDEQAKTAVLTRERNEAVRIAKGGSLLRRIARNAKWLAIGAAAGAIAAKAHR